MTVSLFAQILSVDSMRSQKKVVDVISLRVGPEPQLTFLFVLANVMEFSLQTSCCKYQIEITSIHWRCVKTREKRTLPVDIPGSKTFDKLSNIRVGTYIHTYIHTYTLFTLELSE